MSELRYVLRRLVRAPGFTVVAVLTLAIGIGANSAIFGLVDAVLLRGLPYPEPDRLVMLWQDFSRRGGAPKDWFSPGNFLDWRERGEAFSAMGAFTGWGPTLTGDGGDPRALAGGVVSAGFLDLLGAKPAAGRLFTRTEEAPGAADVVVLGNGLWQRRFGGDPGVVGRTIRLGGRPYQVVGVLESGFDFPLLPGTDVFTPLTLDPATAGRGNIFIRVVARLAPGVPLERARSEAAALAGRLEEEHPRVNAGVGGRLDPLRDVLVGDVRLALLVLFAGVGLVLLIACVNLASLVLARSAGRRRERAVRAALGAGALRIARLQLLESGVLGLAGAGAGLLLAGWLMDLLVALSPLGLPPMFHPSLSWGVAAFAIGLGALTGLAFGVAPALGGSRPDVVEGLKEGARGSAARARGREALVVAQVGFALALLVAAGLLTHSFLRLRSVDPGFDPDGLLSFGVNAPAASYPEDAQVETFYRSLVERLEALPGVASAGVVSSVPFSGGDTDVSFVIEGQPAPEPGHESVIWYRQATPGYLSTMGIPLLRGRGFTAADRPGAPRVVVLSEAAAERFFPGEDPIGKRLKPGSDPDSDDPWWTVVGVVGSVRHAGLDAAPKLEMYLPEAQSPRRDMTVVMRAAAGDAAALAPGARAVVKTLDPALAISGVSTMDALISGSVATERFLTLCITAFGLLALLLAALGVYGVLAQLVGQRTRELGIRMALGAREGDVLGLVLRRGAILVAIGLGLGLLLGVLASRLVRGLLFEVSPLDPLVYLLLPLTLAAAALLAGYIPARRAARVDPVTALRSE